LSTDSIVNVKFSKTILLFVFGKLCEISKINPAIVYESPLNLSNGLESIFKIL